jgi:hypothetical protein
MPAIAEIPSVHRTAFSYCQSAGYGASDTSGWNNSSIAMRESLQPSAG